MNNSLIADLSAIRQPCCTYMTYNEIAVAGAGCARCPLAMTLPHKIVQKRCCIHFGTSVMVSPSTLAQKYRALLKVGRRIVPEQTMFSGERVGQGVLGR